MDPRRRKTLIYIAGALLLIAAALLPVVYGLVRHDDSAVEKTSTSSGTDVSGSGLTTVSPEGAATVTPDGSNGSSSSSAKRGRAGLTVAEAAALEAELRAIEKALDSMSMPDDSDFKDIESGLK